MMYLALVHGFKFAAPPRQQAQAFGWVANFIAQVVSPAAERIYVIEVLVQAFGQQERDDVEVFVVMGSEPACVRLGFGDGIFIAQRLRRVDEFFGGERRSQS